MSFMRGSVFVYLGCSVLFYDIPFIHGVDSVHMYSSVEQILQTPSSLILEEEVEC